MQGYTEEDHLTGLYRRFAPGVYRRALTILRNSAEAQDVLQDTFLGYMHSESSLRGAAAPFTVLYQIATYKAVDRLRHNARWSGTLGPLDVLEDDEDGQQGPRLLSNEGGLNHVEAAMDLALLTEGESKQVLTAAFLYFVEGNSLEAVGGVLGMERHQVSRLLRQFAERARKRGDRLRQRGPS
jgi:RNA polymerase sigma factor (sigma-70 family)